METKVKERWLYTSFVYFIQEAPCGPIKIGKSVNPFARMRSLQTSHARPLHLLVALQEQEYTETLLHKRFWELHLRGEWFTPGLTLLNFLTALVQSSHPTHNGLWETDMHIGDEDVTPEQRKATAEHMADLFKVGMPAEPKTYLSVHDVARSLRMSTATVYSMIKRGELKARSGVHGRKEIVKDDWDAWVEEQNRIALSNVRRR